MVVLEVQAVMAARERRVVLVALAVQGDMAVEP